MRKLLFALTMMLGIYSAAAQELSFNGTSINAMEHIGDDIKQGTGFSANFSLDLAKENAFNLGPSLSYYKFGSVASDIEELEGDDLLAFGLYTGVEGKKVSFNVGYEVPLAEPAEGEFTFFNSVVKGKLQFLPKKGKGLGLQLGADYFFNKYLFHYTYQFTGGLFLRF